MPPKLQDKSKTAAVRTPLYLMCTQGPVHSIHHPSRLREYVRFAEDEALVAIEPLLLSIGVFIGRARPCHLRLDELEPLTPVAAIRYDRDYRWSLTGLASSVRLNGQFLDGKSVQLSVGDRVQLPPYELVVADPRGSGVLRVVADADDGEEPLEVIDEPEFADTTFELQMPNN